MINLKNIFEILTKLLFFPTFIFLFNKENNYMVFQKYLIAFRNLITNSHPDDLKFNCI